MGREDALRYAIAPLAHGVRRALGVELWQQPRQELIPRLVQTFGGAEELKAALEDAFERALQSMVIGLKAPWLLMEIGAGGAGGTESPQAEKDYCEAFSRNLREPFTQEAQVEGRLLIDFLDGFFLDYDTALDAAPVILGLPDTSEADFFGRLLDAGDSVEEADALAALATQTVREGFTQGVGLEEEHPVVRLAQWRDLLADGLTFHFADIARAHPSWSRYLDVLDEEKLARQDMRAVAAKDETERQRVAQARGLLTRIENYRSAFGDIIPNREWLFDIADRLEDSDETVESDLLQGRPMLARDLPLVVKAAVRKVADGHGVAPIARFSDSLLEPKASTIEVLRRARRDFRRCHWAGENYAAAAYELGALIFSVLGPRGAERYFREALAFSGDASTGDAPAVEKGACEYGLFLAALALEDRRSAIHHLQAAVAANADQYEPFDMGRYKLDAIVGAGGSGMSFLVATEDGKDLVVKTFWDEIAVTDPRPALKELQTLVKARVAGVARIHHLCGYKKRVTYVVSDFIAGDDLETFREARGGEAPALVVAEIGAHASDILARAHQAGVLHRNLKPGNIRVGAGEEGLEVTLLDFAVPNAVLAHQDRLRGIRRLAAWSRLGRQIAEDLAAYTAPEVLKGGTAAASVKADLYSLGATLYRLATGASARKIDPEGLPVEIREIIVRCLAKNPEERPASADEVRDALQAAHGRLSEAGSTSATLATPTLQPPPFDAPAKELTESQEREFGLAGLGLGAAAAPPADAFAAPDPFAAPDADPFAAPPPPPPPPTKRPTGRTPVAPPPQADPFAAPGGDPFAAPGGDPFAIPGGDPFAAPGGDPFAAPGGDPFAAPGADPFAAPGGDPFAAPGGDPFAAPGADPFAAPAGDPFAPTAPAAFGAPGADPFAPQPGALDGSDPFAPTMPGGLGSSDQGARLAPALDPFGAPADPFAVPGDPFAAPAGANALDPFAPDADGGDPFAGAGTGVLRAQDPFAAAPPRQPTPKPMPRPTAKKPPADEEEEEPLDPNEALALLEALMVKKGGPGTATKKAPAKPAVKPAARPGARPAARPAAAAPPAADPFAPAADPFGAPVADPFGAPVADPFAAAADPFGAPVADPFAAAADPFGAPVADPFGAPVADPFAAAAADPFGAPGASSDPFAPTAGGVDPFAAAADPFAAGAADPFAPADPFAAGADPFAPAADPFAPAAGGGFGESAINDPLAGGGAMLFSAESELPPGTPDLAIPDELPMLSASVEAPSGLESAETLPPPSPAARPAAKGGARPGAGRPAAKAAAAPARAAKAEPKLDEEGYGLVISGLALKSKKEAAIAIICEIRNMSREEAYDLCRSPVVPVLKRVTKEEADSAAERFRAAKINCRITERKDRR